VGSDIETLDFNTAISAMMIFLNQASKKGSVTKETASSFTKLLSPFAPHAAEELWQILGNGKSIAYEPWPEVIEEYLKEDMYEYPVSFNGKMRFKLALPTGLSKEEVSAMVMADPRTEKWTGGTSPSNIIVVPDRIVNIVIRQN
jgi:leucyl-tRNA synthetase